ncbi:MAG: DinB family protein [Chitinophagaceae bacterium]|nr:DinB family protein [Chitinophagaceae bacterium]
MSKADILRDLINESLNQFTSISSAGWNAKPLPEKWSKKEVLGHLIDSCVNNSRRFIVTQYEQNQKIVYKQNEWVNSQDYQHANHQDMIEIWRLLNLQLAATIENIPAEKLQNTCITDKPCTLEWLIDDYISHARHHLGQILG